MTRLRAVLYQVLNKQVPVVSVPVQVLCINYQHSVTLQLHKVKVVSFIFKKQTELMNFKHSVVKSLTTVFSLFWLASCYTCSISTTYKKIFFLATSTLLQVPVLKIQVPVLCMQVPVPCTTRLAKGLN